MAEFFVVDGSVDLSLAASYRGGTGPSAGDKIHILGGSQTITVGPAVNLNAMFFGPNFRGNFSGTVECSSGTTPVLRVNAAGGYYNITAGALAITTIEAAQRSGELRVVSGTTTNLKAYSGTTYVDGAAVVTTIYNFGGTVNALAGAGTTTTFNSSAGVSNCRRTITTVNADGSTFFSQLDNAVITTANVGGSATYRHNAVSSGTNPLTSTLTTLNLAGRFRFLVAGALANPIATTVNVNSRGYFQTRSGSVTLAYTTLNNNADATMVSEPSGGSGSGEQSFPID